MENRNLPTKFDVAIVGAGPAGSSLAIRLASADLRVLLVEQKKFPREKLCGEFISPECRNHFEEIGVLPVMTTAGGTNLAETMFFARNGRSVAVQSEWFANAGSLALGLSRAEMDELLMNRARESGVDVREETAASGLLFDKERVIGLTLKGKNTDVYPVSAEITIDATGRTRSLARRFEKAGSAKKAAKFVAFKTHLRGAAVKSGACEIYAYRGGYGGCNRVENNLYNLCFIASSDDTKRLGSDAERVLRDVVFTNRRAAEAMRNAEVVKPWLAVPIERFGRGELVPAEGFLTAGDAAAFIDPFTGSGILMSLESAKIAAAAIIDSVGDFDSLAANYRKNYAAAFDARLRFCSMLRHAAFVPFLAEATISLLALSAGLRRRIARSTRFSAERDV